MIYTIPPVWSFCARILIVQCSFANPVAFSSVMALTPVAVPTSRGPVLAVALQQDRVYATQRQHSHFYLRFTQTRIAPLALENLFHSMQNGGENNYTDMFLASRLFVAEVEKPDE